MKNKIILAAVSIFLILVLTASASAWGVSSPYWDKGASEPSPLKIYSGETKTIALNLQNTVGNEDVAVKAEIKQGSYIASLEKDIYTIKTGTSEDAPLKINAPTVTGTYKIEIEFKAITTGGTGGIAMGTGYTISFDIIVSEKQEEKPKLTGTSMLIILTIVIIAIAIVIYYIIRRKK